jgi:hypothetical protein
MFSEVRIEGLETLDYLDNLKNRERFTEQGDAITFESEVSICSQWSSFLCFYVFYWFILPSGIRLVVAVLVHFGFFDAEGGQSILKHPHKNCYHRP